MSSPPKPDTPRERLKLRNPFRRLSQDRSTKQSSSSASPTTSRPPMQATMSQTQILPGRNAILPKNRPTLGPLQQSTQSDSGNSWKQRSSSLEFPERLQHGDDVGEDVTAPHDPNLQNRSLVNMITAAGAKSEFHVRLEDISSESEGEDEDGRNSKERHTGDGAMSTPTLPRNRETSSSKGTKRGLLQTMHRLNLGSKRGKGPKDEDDDDDMSSSQILIPPRTGEADSAPKPPSNDFEAPPLSHDAPFLSMILKGEADMQAQRKIESGRIESTIPEDAEENASKSPHQKSQEATLSTKLMEIFDLKEPEEVIAEYPTWFLQTVLLSGYLYVTAKHICFYAYLPRNTKSASKSGYLGKRGHRNPRYKRYYVELKGDVLRYFTDPNNKYLPSGQIDLRYGISATIEVEKQKSKEESHYVKLVTKQSEYSFKADSPESARDWVKQLQRVIFRSHNDGDSVKILLPIDNVVDMEVNEFLGVADTVKLKVIDNEETYAVDEYFFSFFDAAKEAAKIISIMVESNAFHADKQKTDVLLDRQGLTDPPDAMSQKPVAEPAGARAVQEPGRATFLPFGDVSSSQRSSFESRRRSNDTQHPRSTSSGREQQSRQSRASVRMMSEDSQISDWNDHGTESSAAGIQSMENSNLSASQILDHSDIFRAPTSHIMPRSRSRSTESRVRRRRRASQESATHLHTQQGLQMPGQISSGASVSVIPSSPLDSILRAGSYPLSRASDLANMIKHQSRRLSSQVTTQSMDYLEKVSGMWQGPTRHYAPVEGMPSDDDDPHGTGNFEAEVHSQRFRAHFALPDSEQLIATYFGSFWRILPLYGKIYISQNYFCYRSLLPGTRTKLVLPLTDIENIVKKKASYRQKFPGVVITIRGHEEIFFDFSKVEARDDCTIMLLLIKQAQKTDIANSGPDGAVAEYQSLESARASNTCKAPGADIQRSLVKESQALPVLFDDPRASILNFKPTKPLRITCLTIGSRGDVQPFIALAKGLMEDGHHVKITTHAENEPWVRSHGIDFASITGDPAELMALCIEHGMFTYDFLKEAHTHFRDWIDDLLMSAWNACQGSDLLIEAPSAMAGIHIAEALKIPYFRAFTMPWTRTRAYPHAFAVPEIKRGGAYNYMTYSIIENIFWQGIASNVNRWRRKTLGLPSTSFDKMQANKVPFLYCFSPSVVPPPLDFSDWVRITGYWYLDEGKNYKPSAELAAFMQKAREDGKKLVYIGFGSILIEDPTAFTKTVFEAVEKADVRCILAKGWSDRTPKSGEPKADPSKLELPVPSSVFPIKSIPHDWLFPRCDALCFHGGSGTTGEAMRAGVPIVIKAFFGDQFFFAGRGEDLGVGISIKKMNSTVFGRALWEATRSERMKARAQALGEQIRREKGVQVAITAIYRDLEYARSLIKHDQSNNLPEDIEEHWTFVEAAATAGEEETLAEEAIRMSLVK